MTREPVERAVELYRTEGLALREAAAQGDVPVGDLATELRSRDIFLRPEDARGANKAYP